MKIRRKTKKGFTLVELVVVIAVIAVLAAVSVGAYFGITDSANSSNATMGAKQIKDLWTMYSVSDEFDSNASADEIAQDFCLRYAADNGPSYYVNYDIVKVDPVNGSSAYGQEGSDEAILFKIETEYPTWFLVNDIYVIEESSTTLKTNEDFNNSLIASERLVLKQKILDEFNKTDGVKNYVYPFKIETVGKDVNGKDVRGFAYYDLELTVLNNDDTVDYVRDFNVKPGTILKDVHVTLNTDSHVEGEESNEEVPLFDVFETNNPSNKINTRNVITVEHNPYIDKVRDLVPGTKFAYYLGPTYQITSKLVSSPDLNLTKYEALLVKVGENNTLSFVYSHSLNALCNLINNDQSSFNFIFTHNYTVKAGETVVIPQNTALVVDFFIDDNSIAKFVNDNGYGTQISFETITKINDEYDPERTGLGTRFNETDNILREDDAYAKTNGLFINRFTVEEKGTLTISEGSYFLVEGFVTFANSSVKIGVGNRGELVNYGNIILNNANFRSLGESTGTGVISAQGDKGSNVIEVFKPHDYKGGSYIANAIMNNKKNNNNRPNGGNVFPFIDYQFDNIKCKLEIYHKSDLSALIFIDLRGKYVPAPIALLSENDGSLFKTIENNIIDGAHVIKSHSNNKMNLEILNSTTDGTFKMELDMDAMFSSMGSLIAGAVKFMTDGYFNNVISSEQFNFPLSNMNIYIRKNASLNLDTNNARYEILPSTYIEVSGNLEIGSNTKVALISHKDVEQMNTTLTGETSKTDPRADTTLLGGSVGDIAKKTIVKANFSSYSIETYTSTATGVSMKIFLKWSDWKLEKTEFAEINEKNRTVSQYLEYLKLSQNKSTLLKVVPGANLKVNGELFMNESNTESEGISLIDGIKVNFDNSKTYKLRVILYSSGMHFPLMSDDLDAILDGALGVRSHYLDQNYNVSKITLK